MEAETESRKAPVAARIVGALPCALRDVLCAYLAFTVICIGLFANAFEYGFYLPLVKENGIWLLLGAVVLGVLFALGLWTIQRAQLLRVLEPAKRFAIFVGVGVLVLLVLQFLLAQSIGFVAGSDSGMMTNVAEQRANSMYFSRHPNNLFCEGLFTLISAAAWACGAEPQGWLVAGGCLCVAVAVGLGALTAHKVAGAACGVAVFMIGAVWLGLSPMAQVPYTDAYGILWPVLTLYLYICVPSPQAKWPSVVAVAVLGFYMKAPTLAVLGAIIVVEACLRIRKIGSGAERIPWRRVGIVGVLCLIVGVAAFSVAQGVRSIPDVAVNPEHEIGAAHYLMIGVGENLGTYSKEDVEFSASFETREERTAANLAEWQRRVAERGPAGMGALLLAKTATVFGNGSFFWGGDGIWELHGQNDALLGFYGLHFEDDRVKVTLDCPWIWLANIVWFTVLVGCVLCVLRRKPTRLELVIGVTLLLFCLYTLIFEANPRYPFIFAPLFLIMGTLGWEGLTHLRRSR